MLLVLSLLCLNLFIRFYFNYDKYYLKQLIRGKLSLLGNGAEIDRECFLRRDKDDGTDSSMSSNSYSVFQYNYGGDCSSDTRDFELTTNSNGLDDSWNDKLWTRDDDLISGAHLLFQLLDED
jgi:hypothetical protein